MADAPQRGDDEFIKLGGIKIPLSLIRAYLVSQSPWRCDYCKRVLGNRITFPFKCENCGSTSASKQASF